MRMFVLFLCAHLLYKSSWKYNQLAAGQLLSGQPVWYGKGRKYWPVHTTHKITPAGSLSSSQPGWPPCWASALAFGLIDHILPEVSDVTDVTVAFLAKPEGEYSIQKPMCGQKIMHSGKRHFTPQFLRCRKIFIYVCLLRLRWSGATPRWYRCAAAWTALPWPLPPPPHRSPSASAATEPPSRAKLHGRFSCRAYKLNYSQVRTFISCCRVRAYIYWRYTLLWKLIKYWQKYKLYCLTFKVFGWAVKSKHKKETKDGFKEFGLSQLRFSWLKFGLALVGYAGHSCRWTQSAMFPADSIGHHKISGANRLGRLSRLNSGVGTEPVATELIRKKKNWMVLEGPLRYCNLHDLFPKQCTYFFCSFIFCNLWTFTANLISLYSFDLFCQATLKVH